MPGAQCRAEELYCNGSDYKCEVKIYEERNAAAPRLDVEKSIRSLNSELVKHMLRRTGGAVDRLFDPQIHSATQTKGQKKTPGGLLRNHKAT